MEFLEQEHISPALLDGVRAYRAQYPAEPALQGRIPQPRYHYYGKEVWEAAMSAGNFHLDNLCAIVDNNNIQIDGTIEEIMSPYPIDKKFEDFGWNVICCDGHNVSAIHDALEQAKACKGKPSVIVAKTTKGKGVSFMENSCAWHGNDPDAEQYALAAAELDAALEVCEKEAAKYE